MCVARIRNWLNSIVAPYTLFEQIERFEPYILLLPVLVAVLSACLYHQFNRSFLLVMGMLGVLLAILLVFVFAFHSILGPPRTGHGLHPSRLFLVLRHYAPAIFGLLRSMKVVYRKAPPDERERILEDTARDVGSSCHLSGPALRSLTIRFGVLLLSVIIAYSSCAWMLSTWMGDRAFTRNFTSTCKHNLCEESGVAWRTFMNHSYFTTVTAVTLGYGDFVPNEMISEDDDPPRIWLYSRYWSILTVLSFVMTLGLMFPSAVANAVTVDRLVGDKAQVLAAIEDYFEDPYEE